jgi:hypothetical protein
MRKNLDIDRLKTNTENYVKEEIIQNITANTPIRLPHDIFYKEDFKIYSDINNKSGSKLEVVTDYSFEETDEIATYDSQRLCYKTISFKEPHELVYIDYWVYGDTLLADMFNELEDKLNTTLDVITKSSNAIDNMTTELSGVKSHIEQTDKNVSGLNTRLTAAEDSLLEAQEDIEELSEQLNNQEENGGELASRLNEIEETLNGDGQSASGLIKEVGDFIDSKNQNNGIVGLNENGKIPGNFIEATVIEADDFNSLPKIGKDKTIYITKDDNVVYRWDGNEYITLISSGGSGINIKSSSFYAFYVADDGYLYMVHPEGEDSPEFEVDDDGYLWATFEIEDEA